MKDLFEVDYKELKEAGYQLPDPPEKRNLFHTHTTVDICLQMFKNYNQQLQRNFDRTDAIPVLVSEQVSLEEIPERYHFQVQLTNHPIIRDKDGTLCYRPRPTILWLRNHVNLNDMWFVFGQLHSQFTTEDFMQFYRDIGYTLQGFEEIWSDVLDEMASIYDTTEDGEGN